MNAKYIIIGLIELVLFLAIVLSKYLLPEVLHGTIYDLIYRLLLIVIMYGIYYRTLGRKKDADKNKNDKQNL